MLNTSKFGEVVQFLVDHSFDFDFDCSVVSDTRFFEITVHNYFDADVFARDELESWFQNNFNIDVTAYDRKGVYWTTVKETVDGVKHQLDIRLIFDVWDHSQWR